MTEHKNTPNAAEIAGFALRRAAPSEGDPKDLPWSPASGREPWTEMKCCPSSAIDLNDLLGDLLPDPLPIPPEWETAPPLPGRDDAPAFLECGGGERMPESRGLNLDNLRPLADARAVELAPARPPSQKPSTTSDRILARGNHLLERYRWTNDLMGIPRDSVDALEFANFALSLKPDFSAGAWRECREAAKTLVKKMPHPNMEVALALLESDIAYSVKEARLLKVGCGRAATRISRAHFEKILVEAPLHSKSALVPAMTDWIVATANTGIATHWQGTDIEEYHHPDDPTCSRRFLHVIHPNCAASSAPWVRTLELSNFSSDTYDAVRRHVDRVHLWTRTGLHQYKQTQIIELLGAVCKKLFRNQRYPYTMDTMRAQFISNMRIKCSPAVVAALIGDIPRDTVAVNYTKNRHAWRDREISDIPVPDARSVAALTRRIAYREARNRAKGALRNLAEHRRAARQARNV